MASIVVPRFFRLHGKAPAPLLTHSSTPARTLRLPAFAAFRASGTPDSGIGDAAGHVPGILRIRRPDVSPEVSGKEAEEESSAVQMEGGEEGEWVDWENQILEETVPLVGLVRMILHSGKYAVGDRLSVKHEEAILEKLLIYHPESKKKVGCGIDYITVGFHSEFPESRCLFIVRKDGQSVDFSYWKCIKGLIRKKYPLFADSFILRHFRRRRERPNE